MNKPKHPGGRPTKYTKKLADAICEEIENSPRGIDYLCEQHENWPTGRTVRTWLRQHSEFLPSYVQAKERQAEKMADETVEIAYDDKKDWKVIVDDEGNEKTVHVAESVNRARLKIDTLKWHASKLAPKKYGEQKKEDDNKSSTLIEKIIDKL